MHREDPFAKAIFTAAHSPFCETPRAAFVKECRFLCFLYVFSCKFPNIVVYYSRYKGMTAFFSPVPSEKEKNNDDYTQSCRTAG